MTDDNGSRNTAVNRRRFLATAGVSAFGALAGCSSGDGSSGDGSGGTKTTPKTTSGGTKTLSIGQVCPLTGAGKVYGLPSSAGHKMAVEDINQSGGIEVGGTTYKLSFEALDSQCAPTPAKNAATKLIKDRNVDLMMGGNCPTANLAWMDLIKDSETFLVVDGNESVSLHGMDIEHMFEPFTVIYNQENPNLARHYPMGTFTVNELGFSKVAFLTPELQYGLEVQKYISQAVEEAGGSVEAKVTHKLGASDFSNQITKLKSTDADAIISSTFPNSFFQFLKQAGEKGLRDQKQIITAQAPSESVANQLVSNDVADGFLEFALTPEPAMQAAEAGDLPTAPVERLTDLRDRFKQKYPKRTFNSLASCGYEGMRLVELAIKKGGGVDNASLIDGFSSITWNDVKDFTTQFYVPSKGSVSGSSRQGKIFDSTNQAYYENSMQKWVQGKKKYQQLIHVGPYWD